MKTRLFVLTVILFIMPLLAACSTPSGKAKTIFDIIHDRAYLVAGRVTDMGNQPVPDCKVVLIKRRFGVGTDRTLGYYPIAETDEGGEFLFSFEPEKANNIWVYFDAEDQGFEPKYVEIDHLMGTSIFTAPGNNPVSVHVVIEKASK